MLFVEEEPDERVHVDIAELGDRGVELTTLHFGPDAATEPGEHARLVEQFRRLADSDDLCDVYAHGHGLVVVHDDDLVLVTIANDQGPAVG